jgi:alpha-galactosidase
MGQNALESYRLMSQKLKEAGRPIVFSLCEWGDNKPWTWAKEIGHLWRTTGDIYDCFDCAYNHGTWTAWGAMKILDMQDGLREYAGPGHWNDPDMLEVGVGRLTTSENRAHFSMWCMLAAPLILNRDSISKSIDYNWMKTVVIDNFAKRETKFDQSTYTLRDVWAHKDLGNTQKPLKTTVPGHDVLMLHLKPERNK